MDGGSGFWNCAENKQLFNHRTSYSLSSVIFRPERGFLLSVFSLVVYLCVDAVTTWQQSIVNKAWNPHFLMFFSSIFDFNYHTLALFCNKIPALCHRHLPVLCQRILISFHNFLFYTQLLQSLSRSRLLSIKAVCIIHPKWASSRFIKKNKNKVVSHKLTNCCQKSAFWLRQSIFVIYVQAREHTTPDPTIILHPVILFLIK